MISAFRKGPEASGRGLRDIDSLSTMDIYALLNHVSKNFMVRIPITWGLLVIGISSSYKNPSQFFDT